LSSIHTEDYNKQKLLELQRFVLDRKTTNTRIELYEHMITTTILQHEDNEGTITYNDLKKNIEEDFGIKNIPDLHLKEAINILVEKDDVSMINHKLNLSQVKRNEIKKNLKEMCDLEDKIRTNLFQALQKSIPSISEQQCKKILENLSILLGTTFAKYGSTAARILTEGINRISKLKKQNGFQDMYEKQILSIVSKDVRNNLDEFFNEFFGNPTEEVAKFLFSRAQSYVYFEILNLDPDLQIFEKESWSQKQIYLDTNALMDLIFEGSTLHNTIETLVKETQRLGASIIVTNKTGDEFRASIENSKNKHHNFRVKTKFASFYENAQRQSQFLSTYSHELIKNPKLTIGTFFKRYQEFESIADSKYGITLEETDKEIDLDSEEAVRLKAQISTYAMYKPPELVNHDTYMILRVHKLRDKKTDLTGHKAWMLTTDHSLPVAERGRYGKNFIYASVTPEIWLEIISPFVSPEITIKDRSYAFTKLLSTNFKSHKIPLNDLSTLLSIFWNTEGIDQKHLEIIIGNDFIKQQLADIQKSIDKGEDPPLEKFEPMLKKGLELIQEDFDEKLHETKNEHKQEMNSMQKTITELKDLIENLTIEKKNVEKKFETTKSSYKYVILAIIGSTIIDIALHLGLRSIPEIDIVYTIIPVFVLLGIQVTIIFKIKPKNEKIVKDF
jgi:predicted nucleic acid-binding protein